MSVIDLLYLGSHTSLITTGGVFSWYAYRNTRCPTIYPHDRAFGYLKLAGCASLGVGLLGVSEAVIPSEYGRVIYSELVLAFLILVSLGLRSVYQQYVTVPVPHFRIPPRYATLIIPLMILGLIGNAWILWSSTPGIQLAGWIISLSLIVITFGTQFGIRILVSSPVKNAPIIPTVKILVTILILSVPLVVLHAIQPVHIVIIEGPAFVVNSASSFAVMILTIVLLIAVLRFHENVSSWTKLESIPS